jgi:hypothetical protein
MSSNLFLKDEIVEKTINKKKLVKEKEQQKKWG